MIDLIEIYNVVDSNTFENIIYYKNNVVYNFEKI